jgi:putative GTP pyrophosphokinase
MKLIRHAGDIMLRIADQSIAESYQHWLDAQDLAVIEQIRMPTASKPAPAWISKARVNRAGRRLRDKQPLTGEDYFVLEAWRKAHNHVLNTFQALLRNRTRERGIVVAQRLKRRWTINDKLHREPQMQLARMDDIAGCRMIFESIDALREFRELLHKAKFNHQRKNEIDRYDYIKKPKPTGYRGIHDIYQYSSKSKKGEPYGGLLVELQFRTRSQHAWATAVEVVSRVTENQPKFDKGDERYKEFFRLASEIIARSQEDSTSCRPDLSDLDLIQKFRALDSEINAMRMLRGLDEIHDRVADGGSLILRFSEAGHLTLYQVDTTKAAEEYFKLEKIHPKDDIVLVRADTFDQIRSAYRNYFSDSSEFIGLIEQGCDLLMGENDMWD